jgi:hypothetical protein
LRAFVTPNAAEHDFFAGGRRLREALDRAAAAVATFSTISDPGLERQEKLKKTKAYRTAAFSSYRNRAKLGINYMRSRLTRAGT